MNIAVVRVTCSWFLTYIVGKKESRTVSFDNNFSVEPSSNPYIEKS